jgi:hypothetical protein
MTYSKCLRSKDRSCPSRKPRFLFEIKQLMTDPSLSLQGRGHEKSEPSLVKAADRLCGIASDLHALFSRSRDWPSQFVDHRGLQRHRENHVTSPRCEAGNGHSCPRASMIANRRSSVSVNRNIGRAKRMKIAEICRRATPRLWKQRRKRLGIQSESWNPTEVAAEARWQSFTPHDEVRIADRTHSCILRGA